MLEQINRYSGWFTERARRVSYHRYVCFTKITLPLDFVILIPEYGETPEKLHRILDEHPHKDTSPKLIFDQEEQLVIRTMNDELVLSSIKKIIENEIAELEETGTLSGSWRTNPVRYVRKKDSAQNRCNTVMSHW